MNKYFSIQHIVLIVLIIINQSCINRNSQNIGLDDYRILEGAQVNEIDNLCCRDIIIYDSTFILNDWCNNQGFFTIYKYNPILKVGSFANKGRGPEEFQSPFFFERIIEPNFDLTFSAFDLNSKMIREYDLSLLNVDQYNSPKSTKEQRFPVNIFPSLNLSFFDSCFYGNEIMKPKGLFFKYDLRSNSKTHAEFRPKKFNKKYDGSKYDFLYYNKPIVNYKKHKIVTGMKFFNEVYFYDIDCNHIKTISIGKSILPTLNGIVNITNDSYIYTFDMCSTENYIYILYDGQQVKEYDLNSFENSFVVVLNWEGEHLQTFRINRSNMISVAPNDSFILAYCQEPSGEYRVYKYFIK